MYVALVAIGLFFLAPFAWLITASLNPTATLAVELPAHPSIQNFVSILSQGQNLQAFGNGLFLSLGCAVLAMVCSALAAYPLSRYRLRYKLHFMYLVLFFSCLPVTALMVPVYSMFDKLQLVDSLIGTILFLGAASTPFAIWLMKNFMDSVPRELEEAAWVDGASGMRTLIHVVLPLMAPGLAVILIFAFVSAWGNFYVPFILLLSPNNLPASVTIYQFFGQRGSISFGPLAAYSILYSIPALVLYVVSSRYLGGGFTLGGAVKG